MWASAYGPGSATDREKLSGQIRRRQGKGCGHLFLGKMDNHFAPGCFLEGFFDHIQVLVHDPRAAEGVGRDKRDRFVLNSGHRERAEPAFNIRNGEIALEQLKSTVPQFARIH